MKGEVVLCSGSHSVSQEVDSNDINEILERANLYITTKTSLPLTHAFFESRLVYRSEKHTWCINITKMLEEYGRIKRLS